MMLNDLMKLPPQLRWINTRQQTLVNLVSAIIDVIGRCNDGLGVFEQRRDICIQLSSERWCRVRI